MENKGKSREQLSHELTRLGQRIAELEAQETERKQGEEAQRESEEKYRDLFENARDVIIILDLKGNVSPVNKAAAEYGFSKDDLLTKNVRKFVAKRYWPKLLKELAEIARGNPIEGEIELTTPKGRKFVQYKSNPIRRGKKSVGLQGILRDISEHRKAEEERRQSCEKLQGALEGTVHALASALEIRDPLHRRSSTAGNAIGLRHSGRDEGFCRSD